MAGSRRDEIVREARSLLEAEGPEALTMRRLAARLGMRAPSLYKHIPDKDTLEAAIIAQALGEVGDALSEAAIGSTEPLAAITGAYRRYALEHPHLYRLMTERPLRHDLLPPGTEQRAAAPLLVVGGPDRARALWAFAHGMCQLELAGRFSPEADLDAAWREGIAAFSRSSGS